MASPSSVSNLLTTIFKNAIESGSTCVPPVLIIGDAGIGKSCVVKQVANKLGITLRDRRLSQFPDSGDLVGIPHLSDNKTMEHARPAWLPTEDEGYNILFLDEFNRALLDVRQAAFQLLTEWRINTHKISPKTFLVMAINRDDGENFVNPLDRATLSRMVHINMDVSTNDWIDWAKENNINKSIIKFIFRNERFLYPALPEDSSKPFACPRTWEFVSKLLDLGIKNTPIFKETIIGCLGLETGTSFCTFLSKGSNDILTGYQVLDNKMDLYQLSGYTPAMYEATNKDLKKVLMEFNEENMQLTEEQNKNLLLWLNRASKEITYVFIQDIMVSPCAGFFLEETARWDSTRDIWGQLLQQLRVSNDK